MSAVYLAIGKDSGTDVALSTKLFLPYVNKLKRKGFRITTHIDLKSRKRTGQEMNERGWVAAKRYRANMLPTDAQFIKDFEASLAVCDEVFEWQNPRSKRRRR
jgi:hypothetical protein